MTKIFAISSWTRHVFSADSSVVIVSCRSLNRLSTLIFANSDTVPWKKKYKFSCTLPEGTPWRNSYWASKKRIKGITARLKAGGGGAFRTEGKVAGLFSISLPGLGKLPCVNKQGIAFKKVARRKTRSVWVIWQQPRIDNNPVCLKRTPNHR